MTDQRATFVCPEAMASGGNNLAAVVVTDAAFGLGNLNTFKQAHWQDEDGNLYALASSAVGENFFQVASADLVHPAWDEDNLIDMDGARQAQAAISFTGPASPDKLLVIIGDDYMAQLAQAGLTRVPVDI